MHDLPGHGYSVAHNTCRGLIIAAHRDLVANYRATNGMQRFSTEALKLFQHRPPFNGLQGRDELNFLRRHSDPVNYISKPGEIQQETHPVRVQTDFFMSRFAHIQTGTLIENEHLFVGKTQTVVYLTGDHHR